MLSSSVHFEPQGNIVLISFLAWGGGILDFFVSGGRGEVLSQFCFGLLSIIISPL